MAVLTGGVSLARRFVGDRMLRVVDGLAGVGLLGFGGLLAFRTLARLSAADSSDGAAALPTSAHR